MKSYNKKNMFKSILLCSMLLALYVSTDGQSIVNLSQSEFGNQDHCASFKVHFQPGYSYLPFGSESMHGYIYPSCGNHVKLKDHLDGGHYYAYYNYIRFQYNQEYEVDFFQKLAYKIYDKDHTLVGGVDINGVALVAGSTVLNNEVGENRYDLSFGSLSLIINEYYTLEVLNDKNEKKVLKFKVYN